MYERKSRKLKIMPRLLVVCEGKVTEKLYLEGVRRDFEIPQELLKLEVGKGSPKTLVDIAVKLKEENKRAYAASSGQRYDQVWCVFDRDSFVCIPDAKQKAAAHSINIAFSNPCFELFLLLHFCDCNSALHRSKVRAKLKKQYLPRYDKHFDYGSLRDAYPHAKARAEQINARSQVEGGIERPPYCSFPHLVETMVPSTGRANRRKDF